ncbi:MAG: sigma-70 family RNA polymerase sigma factor, partial [Spirochaetes bacterium]|nr:sigma-70 family RNA polymerase sigma factor [Spirochaetota bacterium]
MIIIIMIWTDEDILRIRNRDPNTFEKIYTYYKDKVYNYLIIKTNNNHDITEDIFSETFHSALMSAPKLKNTKNILGWLLQIANRRFNDHLRVKYREQKYINIVQKEDCVVKDTVEKLHDKEKFLLLDTAINNLKQEYSQILKMKYIEKKS